MNDIKTKLDEAIPTDAIAHREAYKNGPQLSYLSGAYVINRLNQVLGQGNWGYSITTLTKVFEGTVAQYSGDVFSTSYVAQITFWAKITPEDNKGRYDANFEEVGYGDGSDKKSPGKAHELAVKEAVTDGLKRAAKNLGMSFGLQLYFKEGQYVGEESGQSQSTPEATQETAKRDTSRQAAQEKPKKTPTKVLKGQIKNAFAILQDQKKITKEVCAVDYLGSDQTKVKSLDNERLQGAIDKKVENLSDDQVTDVLSKIKQNFPELGLN